MKETGLMFKAPLVRAILSGQKTQTRRLVDWKDLQQGLNLSFSGLSVEKTNLGWVLRSNTRTSSEWHCSPTPCRYGKPGDCIYVRETHAHHPQFAQMAFRADGEEFEDADGFLWEPKWTPAIHMKKEEARIWLEITGVRVERLQQISEADAKAEGVEAGKYHSLDRAYARAFSELWETTGGNWAADPWVWVIDFKTISTSGLPA